MKMLKSARLLSLAGCALALAVAGCKGWWAVGPDYKEPEIQAADVPLPDAGYPTTNKTETGEFKPAATNEDPRAEISAESIRAWWTQFNDGVLTNLVEAAVSNNLSFLMAQERLVQARWSLVGAAAAFLPSITMDGTYTRSGAHGFTSSRGGNGKAYHGDHWNSGFDASWEIDIFGGTRRAYEAAEAQLDASAYTLADAWVSLTAEIASSYVQLRTVQERLTVARANLKLQSETYDILKSRLDSGIGDELAVNQAKYNVEQTRASIPNLDAMRHRPDVRAAERALAAQVASVGVAEAQLFPKFYINGSIGLDSIDANKFFRREAFMGSIGPSFRWPLFQGGNLVAAMKAAESKMSEAALKYELAVQTAYGEMRNAYSSYTQEYHRYQSLQGAVKAAQDAVNISQDLYKNGLADFNNVLDAQRSLLTLEEALAISRGKITTDLIALYKALGGGIALD